MEKISVIIPVYNVERYIEKCISSIMKQSYSNIEIILVNDCSTDRSGKICDQLSLLDKRIRVFHNKKNLGVSNTRNVGLENAKGDLITFVDSDDTIEEDMYEILVKNLKKYNADISACKEKFISSDDEILNQKENDGKTTVYENEEILVNFLMGNNISISIKDKIFKREIIAYSKFKEGLNHNEDKLFCYEIFKKSPKYVQQDVLKYNYFIRSDSLSRRAKFEDYLEIINVNKCIKTDVDKYGNLLQKEAAELNLQLSILAACRRMAETNEVCTKNGEYIELVKQLKKQKIRYSLVKGKKRKIEFWVIRLFPQLYSLIVRLYKVGGSLEK